MILAMMLSASVSMCSASLWDDQYRKAVGSLAEADDPSAASLAGQLERMREKFEAKSDFLEARKRLAQIKTPHQSEVRLEIGALGANLYRVVWVVESEGKVFMLSNFQGHLETTELPLPKWKVVAKEIVDAAGWNAPSAANWGVLDGTAYFVSICVAEGAGQFVVYAPDLASTNSAGDQSKASIEMRRQAIILRSVLKLAHEAH